MSGTHTGNTQPSIDREEHRSVNNINAKAVIPYDIPVYSERYDVEGNTIYVGQALPGSATSAAAWAITKYDLGDMTVASGLLSSVSAVWDNRASEAYS